MAHQNEVLTTITGRIFDRHDVSGRFNRAQLTLVTARRRANIAQLVFSKHAAALAMANTGNCFCQRLCKLRGTIPITLQQLKCNSLCRFPADSGQATQRVNETNQ
jgi:hypothetical protein